MDSPHLAAKTVLALVTPIKMATVDRHTNRTAPTLPCRCTHQNGQLLARSPSRTRHLDAARNGHTGWASHHARSR
jgi:hypothetical protein